MKVEHPGVLTQEFGRVPAPIAPAPTSITGFVGSFPAGGVGVLTPVHSAAEFRQHYGAAGIQTETSVAVHDFFANGGRQAVVVATAVHGQRSTVDDISRALTVLQVDNPQTPPVQLLCVPEMARRTEPFSQQQFAELLLNATGFCVRNRMILLVDPNTSGDGVVDIERWLRANPAWGSTNSVLYFPRLYTPAGKAAGDKPVAASGAVAGVIARTDALHGVWRAPAGHHASIGAVVATQMSDQDQSPLNRHGVNLIRRLDSLGTVIWGARTGVGAVGSEYRYLPVRRTALFLEHSLLEGLQWAVFEPNDESLWATMRTATKAFLDGLWRAGAFAGSTPTDAYFVRCDDTTMSRVDRRRGLTVLHVGFAPLRPAEFVQLKITIRRR